MKFPIGGKHTVNETGWDLGPFSAVHAPGQMSPRATEHEETMRD